MRAAVLYLTTDIFNADGLNVLALATVRGSIPIVDELLNTVNVFRFREHDSVLFDVTYLTPRTMLSTSGGTTTTSAVNRQRSADAADGASAFAGAAPLLKTSSSSGGGCGRRSAGKKSSVGVITDDDDEDGNDDVTTCGTMATTKPTSGRRAGESCLELITSLSDEIIAARLLDISPFRQLVRNQWSSYQWLYVILMIVHMIYMSLYTVYVLPAYSTISVVFNSSDITTPQCHGFSGIDLLMIQVTVFLIVYRAFFVT